MPVHAPSGESVPQTSHSFTVDQDGCLAAHSSWKWFGRLALAQKRPAQVCREYRLVESVLSRWRKAYQERGEAAIISKEGGQRWYYAYPPANEEVDRHVALRAVTRAEGVEEIQGSQNASLLGGKEH